MMRFRTFMAFTKFAVNASSQIYLSWNIA